MKCVWLTIAICAASPTFARTRLNVSDLVNVVTSALAVDRNDQRIAHSVESIQLSERLTPEVTELLVAMGTGPETAHVLRMFCTKSVALPLPPQTPLAVAPVPSESEQHAIVISARKYANDYLAGLPNFIATKAVQKYNNYTDAMLDDRWRRDSQYTIQATHYASHLHAPATKVGKHPLATPISDGEFAGMMAAIFEPTSAASFKWDRWQVIGETRLAVFSYQALRVFSKFRIENLPVGHRGVVFIDPESGAVKRLVLYATGLTEGPVIHAAGAVLEYGEVNIGANRYLLPVRSTDYIRVGQFESREEIEYRDFHKFNADSAIDFGVSEDKASPPN